jgi:hypothetical protein
MRDRVHAEDPWHLPDVPAFLSAVAREVDLYAGLDLLAVVDVSDKRELLAVETLPTAETSRVEDWQFAMQVIAPMLERLCPDHDSPPPPQCTTHLLRCRAGRVVPALDDVRLGYALLYGRNLINTFCGDIVILTPHGWRAERRAGLTPTLTSLGGQALRAV